MVAGGRGASNIARILQDIDEPPVDIPNVHILCMAKEHVGFCIAARLNFQQHSVPCSIAVCNFLGHYSSFAHCSFAWYIMRL